MSAITPTGAGNRDISKSMMTTSNALNPQSFLGSQAKGKMGQTHSGGILKNDQTPE